MCPRCGRMFSGWIAACDSCGASLGPEPAAPDDREAIDSLASVPGISEARAKELVAKGFRDFSDVVRLALPERAVEQGIHHAIARKVMLADLVVRPGRSVSGARCPMCGAAWLVNATRCAACGSSLGEDLDPSVVEQKLGEITGEIVDIATDPDFQGMPEDFRGDMLRAFGGVSEEDLVREEFRRQIDAWRDKGFDVRDVEDLLKDDLERFRDRSARLIRAQVMKKAERGRYRCPLCEALLASTAAECGNCGARFS